MKNGFPCVPGKFHTNAPSYLAQKTTLNAISLAGAAYAENQRTREDLPLGGERSRVTGDTSDFVFGKVVEGSVDDSVEWIDQRAQSSFDAVVTPPGETVVLHFEKIIEIDYDPEGRKIDYAQNTQFISTID